MSLIESKLNTHFSHMQDICLHIIINIHLLLLLLLLLLFLVLDEDLSNEEMGAISMDLTNKINNNNNNNINNNNNNNNKVQTGVKKINKQLLIKMESNANENERKKKK